jgi:hypothetical protein
MSKSEEGKTVMQLKIDEQTKLLLIELAGGARKVGDYLDRIVPDLHAAQDRIVRAEREARQRQLAISILEAQADEDSASYRNG